MSREETKSALPIVQNIQIPKLLKRLIVGIFQATYVIVP